MAHKQDSGGNQVTPTRKAVSAKGILDHIGDRVRHLQDQLDIQRVHHLRVLKDVGIALHDFTNTPLDESLRTIGLRNGSGEEGGIDAALDERGVLLTAVFRKEDQKPGAPRKFSVVSGPTFVDCMMGERKDRASYRDKNYTYSHREDLALETQYCRVQPWTAQVIKEALEKDQLPGMLEQLCRNFARHFNVDVVGIALHSENENDFHVHVLFSRSLETNRRKGSGRAGREESRRLKGILRAELKASGKPATPKSVAMALKEAIKSERFKDPQEPVESIEFIRRKVGSGEAEIRTWGPSYRNKYWVFCAARGDQRDRVAAVQDRDACEPGGFRYRLAELARTQSSPEEHFSDVWTERQWQRICLGMLSRRALEKVVRLRKAAVANYLELGTTMPTPIEAIAAHYRNEKRKNHEISEKLTAAESGLEKQKLENRDLVLRVSAAESQVEEAKGECGVLKAQLQLHESETASVMEKIPSELRGSTISQSVDRLVSDLTKLKSIVRTVVTTFSALSTIPQVLKPVWEKIRQLGELVGINVPEPDKKGIDLDDT